MGDAGYPELLKALHASDFFSALPEDVLQDLAPRFEPHAITSGERLMSRGEPGDSLYLVRHGRLRTSITDDRDITTTLGEIGKGEVVGEMALLTDQNRTADVDALRDSSLYRLSAEAFADLLAAQPELIRTCATVIVDRYKKSFDAPARDTLPATIAVISDVQSETYDWFIDTLAEAFADYDLVRVRESDLGDDDHAARLLDLEATNDIVLLNAGAHPTPWAQQCLRHADRVLVLGETNRSSAPMPIEVDEWARDRISHLDTIIAVVHHGIPNMTGWMRGRTPQTHQNIRFGNDEDVHRLSRRIAGTERVLVLSGGGARGLAHFGVLQVFAEHGIDYDVICGTSAGSLVAGAVSVNEDAAQIMDDIVDWLRTVKWKRDTTLPIVAMQSGQLLADGLTTLLGGEVIENLDRHYFAVSTNLTTGGTHVHDRGPILDAVRASIAVPGVFPPVNSPAGVLVDGGVVDNLPVAEARRRYPSAEVIAIDVGGGESGLSGGELGSDGIVHGAKALLAKGDYPTLPRVLVRLTELGREPNDPSIADVYIRPEVSHYPLLDGSRDTEIIGKGREAALAWIESSRESATGHGEPEFAGRWGRR
ncbi:MAG: cyclic nucleotide-binding domain-containing protein [Acidimicrobiales bacterium]|nr:cyclic nucleotide-binding domain-containing protein [Acidimicrobiales bacterium]RZV44054.1 MAG: cyclic nucleotide-binding domain-containing protein [Acidimicrobiales bacterium]